MKIDINRYRGNYHWIKGIFEKEKAKENFNWSNTATDIAVVSHIPLIAVLCFYGEYYGFNKEVVDKIDSLSKFYGYDDIEGKE
jgi:hypothetical protein